MSEKVAPHPPRVSIVVPLYNAEKYIEICLESIIGQTFRDFELIIVDDCSTDRSLEIVQKFNDPRIKIVRQIQNSGESASRNLGIKIANGKYIYFMDDDDILLGDAIENFYNVAEKSQAEIVYMNSIFETDKFDPAQTNYLDHKLTFHPTPRFLSENLIDRLQEDYVDLGVHVTPWIKIQRRDFLLKHKIYFPSTTLNGDVLFNFAELCFAKKVQVIDACGYIYRLHGSNTMCLSAIKTFRKAILSMPSALRFIGEIFDSSNLISPLDEETKFKLEVEVITRYFDVYLLRSYEGELSIKQTNDVLNELVFDPKMFDPNLIRVLFNVIATKMLENEKLKGESV